jgi:hypothetical protein
MSSPDAEILGPEAEETSTDLSKEARIEANER